MSKSSEVDGGGTAAVVAAPTGSADASPKVVPIEEGGVRYQKAQLKGV